jgi:hypothetical protein
MDSEEVLNEGKVSSAFERHDEFFDLQRSLLSLDLATEPNAEEDKHELGLLAKLSSIVRGGVASYHCVVPEIMPSV